jgi:hypothetical protein
MSSALERKKINHELRKLGFGGLDDPNLIQGIAFCIRDHAHFRNQLFSVLPDKRRHAYEVLRPHLSFAAKPLDVYEAEMKQLAERQQLPRYNETTHQLEPMRIGEIESDEYRLERAAQEAIAQNLHEKERGLHLTCTKCKVVEVFRAKERKQAEREARAAGWRSDGKKDYCTHCAPARCTMKLLCVECERESSIRCWDAQDGYAAARLAGWVINDTAKCPGCSVPKIRLV